MKIATYGTLRDEMPNYKHFKRGLEKVGQEVLTGYKLWQHNHLPIVTRTGLKKHVVKVDLMFVDSPHISSTIDKMELRAGYYIDIITVNEESYKMYLYSHVPDGCKEVLHGDWVKHTEENDIYPY